MRQPYLTKLHFALFAFLCLLTGVSGAQDAPITQNNCPAGATGAPCCDGMHGMHGGSPDGVGMFERMANELALSDAQKQEYGALLEMYRPRIQELVKRGKSGTQDLFAMAPDDPAYNSRAAELSQLAGATAAEMVTLLSELQSSAYALLTKEQQVRFMELRAKRRACMEQMSQKMQEHRAGGQWQPGMHRKHRLHDGGCCDQHKESTDTAPSP